MVSLRPIKKLGASVSFGKGSAPFIFAYLHIRIDKKKAFRKNILVNTPFYVYLDRKSF